MVHNDLSSKRRDVLPRGGHEGRARDWIWSRCAKRRRRAACSGVTHAFERLIERGVTRAEVLRAVIEGDAIEVYAEDRPYPSCLLLHVGAAPLHVVAAIDPEAGVCHIITAYRPDRDHFESDLRTRRKRQ